MPIDRAAPIHPSLFDRSLLGPLLRHGSSLSRRTLLLILIAYAARIAAQAQRTPGYLYDESRIAPYKLLDPLQLADGRSVTTAQQWFTQRRPEILRLFEENIFGHTPETAQHAVMHATVIERDEHALDGVAVREQIDLTFEPAPGVSPAPQAEHRLRLLVYIPAAAVQAHHAAPVIFGLNFGGNQTVLDDPAIRPTPIWSKPKGSAEPVATAPADATRGSAVERWQVQLVLARGYAFATAYYGDLEPDIPDAGQYSVRQLFRLPNQPVRPDDWGAIGAWAWGMSRAFDALRRDPLLDPGRIAITGHSRLGKAADWAAAQDTRFAAVLSTESGHGGQSIQRRALGETVAHLEDSFPYWFCPAYAHWVGRDAEIPADGNLLLSLMAPRPLYVASAVGDEWSDPHGEFLSALSVSRVYRLLGRPALPENIPMPAPSQVAGLEGDVAYHDRTGKHDVTRFDWEHYLDFLDVHWGKPFGSRSTQAPTTQRPLSAPAA